MEKRKVRLVWAAGAIIVASLLAAAGFWWFSPAQQRHRQNKALIAACTAGDVGAVTEALAGGADVNARDENGLTPLMHAARGDRPAHERPDATDHPEVVQLLLQKGADVNAATDTGFVALFWAARYGHAKVVKVLIDNGANVNAKDKDGMTAMKWAGPSKGLHPNYEKVLALLGEAGEKE
jgi:ankyrin repeat protein